MTTAGHVVLNDFKTQFQTPFLTMNLEHMLGSSLSVQVVYALRNNDNGAPLLLQPGLALCYGQMDSTGLPVQHQPPSVMIELPHSRWVAREGFWSRKVLRGYGHREVCLNG